MIFKRFKPFYINYLRGICYHNKCGIFYIVKQDKNSIFVVSFLKSMNRIKEVSAEKGIKQKWIAKKLGKSYNMVNA